MKDETLNSGSQHLSRPCFCLPIVTPTEWLDIGRREMGTLPWVKWILVFLTSWNTCCPFSPLSHHWSQYTSLPPANAALRPQQADFGKGSSDSPFLPGCDQASTPPSTLMFFPKPSVLPSPQVGAWSGLALGYLPSVLSGCLNTHFPLLASQLWGYRGERGKWVKMKGSFSIICT